LQTAFQSAQAARICIFARSNSENRLGAALQMKRTLPKFFAQPFESDWFVEMLLDEAADCFHAVGLGVSAGGLGPATEAGAISSLLGLLGPQEELHVLPTRPASGTGRPAIHSGGRYGEYETAILRGVTRGKRVPPRLFHSDSVE
jgi:hypothetical protein